MSVFTVIGMLVVGLIGVVVVVALVLAALSGRVGRLHTVFRRYAVCYPDTSKDPRGPFKSFTNHWLDRRTLHFTFAGATRTARRTRGTRIFDRWDLTFTVVRGRWSELKNGYQSDRDAYGDVC